MLQPIIQHLLTIITDKQHSAMATDQALCQPSDFQPLADNGESTLIMVRLLSHLGAFRSGWQPPKDSGLWEISARVKSQLLSQMTPAQQEYWKAEGGYFQQVRRAPCYMPLSCCPLLLHWFQFLGFQYPYLPQILRHGDVGKYQGLTCAGQYQPPVAHSSVIIPAAYPQKKAKLPSLLHTQRRRLSFLP